MMLEYDSYFDYKHEGRAGFFLYGYNTEDTQIIENTEGNSLTFINYDP